MAKTNVEWTMAGSQVATGRASEVKWADHASRFVPIGIDESTESSAVRLCVMLHVEKAGSYPIVLRETLEARVFLGALVDRADNFHHLLEVHVQHVEQLSGTSSVHRDALTNEILDERWGRIAEAMARSRANDVIRTQWEREHPRPTLIDVKQGALVPLQDEFGGTWRICCDDALLRAHGLPPYSTSLHRYLVLQSDADAARFAPITAGSPESEQTVPLDQLWPGHPDLIPFNLGCGLMLIRSFDPVPYERFVDYLSGAASSLQGDSIAEAVQAVNVSGSNSATCLDEANSTVTGWGDSPESSFALASTSGRLFLGRQSHAGRLLETLHLKLRVFADTVQLIRSFIYETGTPLLNVRADSFRVRLGPQRSALPFLWTARSILATPGEATRLPFAAGRSTVHEYFLPSREDGVSIYTPASAHRAMRGRCSMRFRQIVECNDGEVIAEGTFSTHERVHSSRGDLIIMRLPISGKRFELHATMDADEAMASGEWRFRSGPIELRARDEIDSLRRVEGVLFDQVEFELVPMLSTPHDLYALGVLATRTFLVNEQTTLSKALDEVLSLARRVSDEHDPDVGLCLRIFAAFDQDSRWQESLGPHRLTNGDLSPDAARSMIPQPLWWQLLAMIVRSLPGIGPDSICHDFSDCPPGGLWRPFDPLLRDLDALLLETRNLTTFDWIANKEIHEVISELRSETTR